jgi:hypothetical protein
VHWKGDSSYKKHTIGLPEGLWLFVLAIAAKKERKKNLARKNHSVFSRGQRI